MLWLLIDEYVKPQQTDRSTRRGVRERPVRAGGFAHSFFFRRCFIRLVLLREPGPTLFYLDIHPPQGYIKILTQ
jgi:hypothetical protein